MKFKNLIAIAMIVSSLIYSTSFSVKAADITITDGAGDVSSIDYFTQEAKVVLNHPDITVDNLDLTKATYTQLGSQATISVQVKGIIENRGKVMDLYGEDFTEDIFKTFNTVEYEIFLTTSKEDYSISYSNNSGLLSYGVEQKNLTSSDFSVDGNTLSITFVLTSANETYTNLTVYSTYLKFIYNEENPSIDILSDIAPNPTLVVYEAYASNIGSVGENIQFNGSAEPLTGQPPYTYRWNFGDQTSSNEQNPTHSYKKAGKYTYTFTITDNEGATATESGNITISGESNNNGDDNRMFILLTVILIIVIIGIAIIAWIIRRR